MRTIHRHPTNKTSGNMLSEVETNNNQQFLKLYDEVLNSHVLQVFRRHLDEMPRVQHDRALKIKSGEVVQLRLDCLSGQADGIKISSDKHTVPMYIWFQPDCHKKKIVFRVLCGEKRKRLFFKPEQIHHDFLLNFISQEYSTLSGTTVHH